MQQRGLDVLYDQAESHGGYFTTRQAGEAGISTRLLTYYTGTADIERVAHGVYRLARFPPHRFGDAIAATLWVGPGSAVSHDSALAVYGLGASMPAVVHVSVARTFRGSRNGVVVHNAPLAAEETTVWDDVAVVSVARALVDVATDVDPSLASDAAQDAIRRGLITPDRISAYLTGHTERQRLTRLLLRDTADLHTVTGRYEHPHSLRRALEDRLKTQARTSGLPLDRLRKEAAFERLLARFVIAAPEGSWALKGGLAMLARVGAHARTTADADTTWRADADQLQDTLARAAGIDLADHFEFLIGSPRSLQGEGPEGGVRFPIESRLAGRLFEPIRLDVNLSASDPQPVEALRLRNHFEFAGLPDVVVPAISGGQQLAEKLHAYTRDYATGENTRAKDLYDMLVIAAQLPVPPLVELAGGCQTTFALRRTPWPPSLNSPPAAWARPWGGFVRDYHIPFATLADAYAALVAFWTPALTTPVSAREWDPVPGPGRQQKQGRTPSPDRRRQSPKPPNTGQNGDYRSAAHHLTNR